MFDKPGMAVMSRGSRNQPAGEGAAGVGHKGARHRFQDTTGQPNVIATRDSCGLSSVNTHRGRERQEVGGEANWTRQTTEELPPPFLRGPQSHTHMLWQGWELNPDLLSLGA